MNLLDKLRGQFFEIPQSRLNELVLYDPVQSEGGQDKKCPQLLR